MHDEAAPTQLTSFDQLVQLRTRLREQHEMQVAEAEEAEVRAKMLRSRSGETGAICDRLEAIEKEMSAKVNTPVSPYPGIGGTYVVHS